MIHLTKTSLITSRTLYCKKKMVRRISLLLWSCKGGVSDDLKQTRNGGKDFPQRASSETVGGLSLYKAASLVPLLFIRGL